MIAGKTSDVQAMSLKKIWSDPVWSKVIATGICGAVAYVVVLLGGWEANLWGAVTTAWKYAIASMDVPRWVVGIVGAWSLLTFGLVAVAWLRPEPTASWLSYQKDEFFGLMWRWKLTSDGAPHRVCVFCPACDLQLDPSYDDYAFNPVTSFQCKCGQAGPWHFRESWHSLEGQVERAIQQKLRNGTWKQAVKQ